MRDPQACKRMLALKHDCIDPLSKQPYILDSSGGRDISEEGHQVVPTLFLLSLCKSSPRHVLTNWLFQGAFTHGFVVHFANVSDRKYYLEEDPAHKAFHKSLDGILQNIRIIDYESGIF